MKLLIIFYEEILLSCSRCHDTHRPHIPLRMFYGLAAPFIHISICLYACVFLCICLCLSLLASEFRWLYVVSSPLNSVLCCEHLRYVYFLAPIMRRELKKRLRYKLTLALTLTGTNRNP